MCYSKPVSIDDACDPEITEPILYSARNGDLELGEDEDHLSPAQNPHDKDYKPCKLIKLNNSLDY